MIGERMSVSVTAVKRDLTETGVYVGMCKNNSNEDEIGETFTVEQIGELIAELTAAMVEAAAANAQIGGSDGPD